MEFCSNIESRHCNYCGGSVAGGLHYLNKMRAIIRFVRLMLRDYAVDMTEVRFRKLE